jgi:uncharacterized protein YjbJ (UPF0337 family)
MGRQAPGQRLAAVADGDNAGGITNGQTDLPETWHGACNVNHHSVNAGFSEAPDSQHQNKGIRAMALNQQTLEGNWNEIKGKLHERWGQLTQDDLQKARGNVDQLVGLIQRKTGEARERVEQYLNELTASSGGGVSRVAEAVRGYASSAMDSMRGYGSTAAESADEARARAAEMLRGGYAQTERMIQQRPLESLAVGFGAGLITGVIIGLVMRSGSRY